MTNIPKNPIDHYTSALKLWVLEQNKSTKDSPITSKKMQTDLNSSLSDIFKAASRNIMNDPNATIPSLTCLRAAMDGAMKRRKVWKKIGKNKTSKKLSSAISTLTSFIKGTKIKLRTKCENKDLPQVLKNYSENWHRIDIVHSKNNVFITTDENNEPIPATAEQIVDSISTLLSSYEIPIKASPQNLIDFGLTLNTLKLDLGELDENRRNLKSRVFPEDSSNKLFDSIQNCNTKIEEVQKEIS